MIPEQSCHKERILSRFKLQIKFKTDNKSREENIENQMGTQTFICKYQKEIDKIISTNGINRNQTKWFREQSCDKERFLPMVHWKF